MSEAKNEYPRRTGSAFPPVLDACCGSRMFWFDKRDGRALYVDKRRETVTMPDQTRESGTRTWVIDPDHLADFTNLPFPDNTFACVIFDPPHRVAKTMTGNLLMFYGILNGEWRDMLRRGFAECFRVLRPEGTLVFKWCESDVPLREILALTPEKPLIGNRKAATAKTHWVLFLKPNATVHLRDRSAAEGT